LSNIQIWLVVLDCFPVSISLTSALICISFLLLTWERSILNQSMSTKQRENKYILQKQDCQSTFCSSPIVTLFLHNPYPMDQSSPLLHFQKWLQENEATLRESISYFWLGRRGDVYYMTKHTNKSSILDLDNTTIIITDKWLYSTIQTQNL
jgi:hypothetical protein